MDALELAVREIKSAIHPELLRMAFNFKDQFGFAASSMEESIKANVLRCRVMGLLNITGGEEIRVNTDNCEKVLYKDNVAIYVFPDSVFKGRTLVSVLDFAHGGWGTTYFNRYSGCNTANSSQMGTRDESIYSGGLQQGRRLLDTTRVEMPSGSSKVRMIGPNMIALEDVSRAHRGIFSCLVSHDTDMRDMSPKDHIEFSEISVLAVKAYIYTMLFISLTESAIIKGKEVSAYSTVISTYEGANEEFLVKVKEWGRVAYAADPKRMSRHIMSQLVPEDL